MAIRTDTKDFPFKSKDKGVWYFIINWTERTKNDFYNVQGKKELLQVLKSIIDCGEQANYELIGVWNGQYSTDLFNIPINEGYNELFKHFNY
jgi:hypothetical protein